MPRTIRIFALVFSFLLLGTMTRPATAQVTELTTQDLLNLLGTSDIAQVFETGDLDPVTNSDLDDVLNATGANQVYDVRPFTYSLVGEGLIRYRTVSEAQALGWPGSDDSYFSQASQAFALDLRDANGDPVGSAYNYTEIQTSGDSEGDNSYGGVFASPTEEISIKYQPPLLQYNTPLVFSPTPSTWTSSTTSSIAGDITVSGEVEGYGTIRTPAGDFEVMRIRRETTQFQMTTTDYEFISPDAGFTVATIEGDNLGNFTITLTAISDDFAETSISSNQTGAILSDNRLGISFTSGSSADGQLALATYNREPYNDDFDGTSATSDDGTSITPDVLFDDQYYLVYDVDNTLNGFTAQVCFDASTVPGVSDIQKLVLLTRDFSNETWSPLNTTVNGSAVCASVSDFSQFALGSNTAYNALPVELSTFDVIADDGRALLSWTTLSEQANDGFHIEHKASEHAGWSRIGFVDGAGTTDQAQSYRFRTAPLTPGVHRFRLVQVDLDGTASPTTERTVQIRPSGALTLTSPVPNPAKTHARVGLVLRESAEITVAVFDLLGRRQALLHDGPLSAGPEHTFRVDVSTWASGTYLVRVTGAGSLATSRLTVVH